jgi:hypothetical protein
MISTARRTRDHRISRGGCRAISGVERVRRRSREPVAVEGGCVFFSGRIAQHVKTRRQADWLAVGATVLAAASWGMLVSLLGS